MSFQPPIPADEAGRLLRLRDLMVLDSAPEPVFDSIARLASEVCGVPIALLSLVDAERQWFKANVGLPGVNETARDVAFCAHVVAAADQGAFTVPDATQDVRFADNPLVAGEPDIRFYAGAPLTVSSGHRVGTLCVIDRQPRQLSAAQQKMLESLAAIACQALQMRRNLIVQSLSVRSDHEQTLADREARYRAIVEEQTELVSLAWPSGELMYVNPAYAAHFGQTPAQMVGKSLFDSVEAADRQAVREQLQEVLATRDSRSGDNRMVAPDGAVRWVAWTNSVQLGPGGEVLLHSVGRDITERREADEVLRANQSFLQRTGRVAGIGGWELELATGALRWSEETCRIHEVPPDFQPRLETAVNFYAPGARAVIEAAVQRGISHAQPWDLELPLITATGKNLWVRAAGEVEFEHGKAVRLVGAFQDITERKQLEQRVANNERFVRQVTDSLPVRIAYMDRDARYRFVNLAHCARFGLKREQIIGRTRTELAGGTTDTVVQARIQAVLAGKPQRFEHGEERNGLARRFEIHFVPDIGDDGAVNGFYSTGLDITDRSAAESALRELTAIFDNTSDWVVQTDRKGQVAYMNPAVRRALGLAADAPVHERNFAEFNTPATNALYASTVLPAVKAHGVWVGESTVFVAGLREVPISHMVIAHRSAAGQIERYSAVMRDISAQVQVQRNLQRQTATLTAVIEAIPAIVGVLDSECCYRLVNSTFERWMGVRREDVIGRPMQELLSPTEFEVTRGMAERALAGETVSFERQQVGSGGTLMHLALTYIPLWLDNGEQDGFFGVAHDITVHKQEEGRLLLLSQRDALTGLINRAGFEAYMEGELRQGDGAALALLYIDLDRFKPVNDHHGHPVGDKVLQEFARRLQKLVRPSDAVARLGGDEFAIALARVRQSAHARAVADKVIEAASQAFFIDGLSLHIGASVGVSFGADPQGGWGDLVQRADANLYLAKAGGRGRHAGSGDGAGFDSRFASRQLAAGRSEATADKAAGR